MGRVKIIWALTIALLLTVAVEPANGEDVPTFEQCGTEYAVLCFPDSEVNIRGNATTDANKTGWLHCGDVVQVQGVKGRWMYCVGIGNESGDGWVHAGYLTDGEITTYENPASAVIYANGRVSARKSVDGGRRKWLSPGTEVLVTAVGGTWSLTDAGYVKTQYVIADEQEEEQYVN